MPVAFFAIAGPAFRSKWAADRAQFNIERFFVLAHAFGI